MTSLMLKEPKSSVISDGRRKVRSLFTSGLEMLEEFDVITDELLLRKARRKLPSGADGPWIVESGIDESVTRGFNPYTDMLRETSSAPMLSRKDSSEAITFRIRNLPFPKDVFQVTVDDDQQQLVVRTTNKKYFKRIDVPDMQRMGLRLDKASVSWDVQHNTLIVTYAKPVAMRVVEMQEKKERASMQSARVKDDGQSQCAQQ